MKITVIKFNRVAIDAIANLPKDCQIVAICDPDINGRVLAQHELPEVKYYVDTSLAIRESGCDTVLLTISDHAAQLALLAIAYKKSVLKSTKVDFGEYGDRIFALAFATKTKVEFL